LSTGLGSGLLDWISSIVSIIDTIVLKKERKKECIIEKERKALAGWRIKNNKEGLGQELLRCLEDRTRASNLALYSQSCFRVYSIHRYPTISYPIHPLQSTCSFSIHSLKCRLSCPIEFYAKYGQCISAKANTASYSLPQPIVGFSQSRASILSDGRSGAPYKRSGSQI